jgi:hypothetical protein
MSGHSPTPLATLEHCFRLLCSEPGALTIEGRLLGQKDLSRPVPLDELRARLHELDPNARLTVLTILLQRARAGSPAWQVGLAGVLLPGLRHLTAIQATGRETAAGQAHALIWFRATLALARPESDRRILWLLDLCSERPNQISSGRGHLGSFRIAEHRRTCSASCPQFSEQRTQPPAGRLRS